MRRLLPFLIFTIFFLNSMDTVFSACTRSTPCCCENRCWISGVCCKKGLPEEYWHPTGCYDFEVWVEPKTMVFVVGKKTPINLYIKNTEEYTDRYNVSYNVSSSLRGLISVDLVGTTPTDNVGPSQVKKLNPRITVLYVEASGAVWFNVTSWGNPNIQRNVSLTIAPAGLPASLVEFDSLFFFVFVILAGVVYFFFKLNH
jgi:hypothetical protein